MKGPKLQFAVLPWRRAEGLEIMLVSSRETGRWVLPKGWPMKGIKPHKSAAREALEEAGIQIFSFEVEREHKSWLEKNERTRKWFAVSDAAEAVEEPELREAIIKFEMFAMAEPKNANPKKSQFSDDRD